VVQVYFIIENPNG